MEKILFLLNLHSSSNVSVFQSMGTWLFYKSKVACQRQITSILSKLLFSFRGRLILPRIVQLLNFNWIELSAVKPHLSHKFRLECAYCHHLLGFRYSTTIIPTLRRVKYRTLVIFTFLWRPVLPSQLII